MISREDKIQKVRHILNNAESLEESGDAQDGVVAQDSRKIAARMLSRLGLKLEDIQEKEVLVVGPRQTAWEKALAEIVFSHLEVRVESSSAGVKVWVQPSKLTRLKEIYDESRRSVLKASGDFTRQLKMTIDLSGVGPITDSFCNFAVLGVAQELLPELESEVAMPELDRLLDAPGAAHVDYQTTAPSGYRGGQYRHRPTQTVQLSPGPAGIAAGSQICSRLRGLS